MNLLPLDTYTRVRIFQLAFKFFIPSFVFMSDQPFYFEYSLLPLSVPSAAGVTSSGRSSQIDLPKEGKVVLGRGRLLGITDLSCSRNQAELELHQDGKVLLSVVSPRTIYPPSFHSLEIY